MGCVGASCVPPGLQADSASWPGLFNNVNLGRTAALFRTAILLPGIKLDLAAET